MFTCLHVYICDEFGVVSKFESFIPLESSIIPPESSIP